MVVSLSLLIYILVKKVNKEIQRCYQLINRLGRGVVYLGSSRLGDDHPHYNQSLELAREVCLFIFRIYLSLVEFTSIGSLIPILYILRYMCKCICSYMYGFAGREPFGLYIVVRGRPRPNGCCHPGCLRSRKGCWWV